MSIFEVFSLANKIVKAKKAIKAYNDQTHLSEDTKADISIMKEAAERIVKRHPVYAGLLDLIKGIF